MIIINKDNFVGEVEEKSGLVVLDFYADWCGPCKLMAPVMEELEREYPGVFFGKVNVDEEPELARLFKIQSIPTIALVKDNTFADMSVGYVPKSKISELIEEYK